MPFTSETALSAFKARGGHASVRKDEAAGWPRLKKARATSIANRMRRRLERLTAPVIIECQRDCPCRMQHQRPVNELTELERAIIAGMLPKPSLTRTKSRTINVDATNSH